MAISVLSLSKACWRASEGSRLQTSALCVCTSPVQVKGKRLNESHVSFTPKGAVSFTPKGAVYSLRQVLLVRCQEKHQCSSWYVLL